MNRRDFLASIGGAAATLVPAGRLQAASQRPNIVFIYADDVGYGDISAYGATKIRTPNLDRLAAQGMRLTNAHSSSATCTPSRYSLLTGEYAWRKQGTGVLPGNAKLIIQPGRVTLPSSLKQQGYTTGAVGKWHLGLGDGTIDWNGEIKPGPLEIGFDYAFIMPATGDRVPCVYLENHRVVNLDPKDPIQVRYDTPFPGQPTGKANPELLRMKSSHGHDQTIVNGVGRIGYMTGGKSALWNDETIAQTLTGKANHFIDSNKGRPFFLYFATHDVHVPRLPGPQFSGKSGLGARGDAILELDWTVGQVLDNLDRNNLTKNTLVIFSSDNGPVVDDGYRDGSVEHLGTHRPAGPYRGGKYSNFDGGTRIPFMVRWPGHVKPDQSSDALISQVDILSSLAALTGAKIPEDAAPDSFNELPAILGQSKNGRKYLIEHAGTLSIIEGNWKLILPSNKPKVNQTHTELGNDPKPQLYDLATDIGETHNVAEEHPDVVARLNTLLEKVRTEPKTRS
jgi:arylsulfatase A-like enzyme